MPTACAYICEHPCEARCRRNMVDAPINIRGLKRYAVDHAGNVPNPACGEATGKRVAIIGGGPSGLSCAYYLRLMGHSVTIFEEKKRLGGMLRYGIPAYRFPREKLDAEIASILSTGVEVHTEVTVGKDISFEQLHKDYDCLYVAIGGASGQENRHSRRGQQKRHVCRRNAARHRRRHHAGLRRQARRGHRRRQRGDGRDKKLRASGRCQRHLRLSPQNCGHDCASRRGAGRNCRGCGDPRAFCAGAHRGKRSGRGCRPLGAAADQRLADKSGRPRPDAADQPKERIPADIIVVAIGQGVEIAGFEQAGIPIKRGTFMAESSSQIDNMENVFAGGDCVTGPATAIRAIAAGKVAAANIDEQLGFHHEIRTDVEIPAPHLDVCPARGRVNTKEREAAQRKCDFKDIECGMTHEEACAESGRCLRCDHFGYGIFKGGRIERW